MARRKLTADQKAERLERRAARRAELVRHVEGNRAWHEQRTILAEKRKTLAAVVRTKLRRKAAKNQPPPLTVTIRPHEVSKRGQRIDSTLGTSVVAGRKIVGTHDERRAAGARAEKPAGTTRLHRPRRRTLPAHEQRRLEQARRDNAGAW